MGALVGMGVLDGKGVRVAVGVSVTVGVICRVKRPFLTANEAMWNLFEPQLKKTLAELTEQASTRDKDLGVSYGGNVEAAKKIGQLVADRAKAAGVEAVVFDRGGNRYHGRIKALADAAREAGLKF